ncbi:hypothetical protein [Thiohalophilus sp.]|uniref:hypothetical protein n=1 Tax=Thiohalophilus sp. TaxID=3028392 RepID=UPI002ACE63A3|nr:hypothetical protein [Thiohalophilus sp.]MDZ7805096.1 hypothetical protein [Thiohalophilus sp.]MDZ7805100.1 hypothetical protein [Thiohalophilus sp.]
MIGLYVLGLVLLWVWLTWLLLRYGLRVWMREKGRSVSKKAFVSFIIVAWLGTSFWYGGGRKIYWDWRVDQMCAVDGGVRVYETVTLPGHRFDKYGIVRIPIKRKAKSGDEYHYERNIYYYREENPAVWRLHFEIYRRMDKKLLGEATTYARRGGDIPGSWHESSFGCDGQADIADLKKKTFVKEN